MTIIECPEYLQDANTFVTSLSPRLFTVELPEHKVFFHEVSSSGNSEFAALYLLLFGYVILFDFLSNSSCLSRSCLLPSTASVVHMSAYCSAILCLFFPEPLPLCELTFDLSALVVL